MPGGATGALAFGGEKKAPGVVSALGSSAVLATSASSFESSSTSIESSARRGELNDPGLDRPVAEPVRGAGAPAYDGIRAAGDRPGDDRPADDTPADEMPGEDTPASDDGVINGEGFPATEGMRPGAASVPGNEPGLVRGGSGEGAPASETGVARGGSGDG